jgi:hypothetical protein
MRSVSHSPCSFAVLAHCDCNYCAEIMMLNMGRLDGSGVVDVPKFHVTGVCRNVPKRHIA